MADSDRSSATSAEVRSVDTSQARSVMTLCPLADVVRPEAPTASRLMPFTARLKKLLSIEEADPAVERKRLAADEARTAMLPVSVGQAEIIEAIDDHVQSRRRSDRSAKRSGSAAIAICLPPSARECPLSAWARSRGYTIIEAPERAALLRDSSEATVLPRDDSLVVVPALEHWFLRHRLGLDDLRSLLGEIADHQGTVVVGVSTWAWCYLDSSLDLSLLLHSPHTLNPLDARMLRDWLEQQMSSIGETDVRLASTGRNAFDVEEDGEPVDDHMQSLAARSGGIPWIAWSLWRASLHRRTPGDRADSTCHQGASETWWVLPGEPSVLPVGRESDAGLVLAALLVHGRLEASMLAELLPFARSSLMLCVLEREGFIEQLDSLWGVTDMAYPAIRDALSRLGHVLPDEYIQQADKANRLV